MKLIFIILNLFLILQQLQAQNFPITNQILTSLPEEVEIIGLGDPTHQESTITQYRIDLIKQLVLQKEFSILAIEGNLYELYRGYERFLESGKNKHIEGSMYSQLNSTEMEDLYQFVYSQNQEGNPIKLMGYDIAFSGQYFIPYFREDLRKYTQLTSEEIDSICLDFEKLLITNLKALFINRKKLIPKIITHCEYILSELNGTEDIIFKQAINNIIEYCSSSSARKRDQGMMRNLQFIRSTFPNEKVILFGSSTHLLKNPQSIQASFFQTNGNTFGELLDSTYQNTYYFVGYTGLSGFKYNFLGKNPKEIKMPVENSIEHLILKQTTSSDTYITSKTFPLQTPAKSRFLGHSFLSLDLWKCLDALVLIKDIKPCVIKYQLE